jgi:hypothetical protein
MRQVVGNNRWNIIESMNDVVSGIGMWRTTYNESRDSNKVTLLPHINLSFNCSNLPP